MNLPGAKDIIAQNLKPHGWSLGRVSAVDCQGRTIWIADAHRGDGKRYVVRVDKKLSAFLELESTTRAELHCGKRGANRLKPVGRRLRD